jgi:putative peptidoglycan lipid II flippase
VSEIGRHQLVTPHGERTQLQFWQGFDLVSEQEVALTLVDPDRELPEEFIHEILARTVRMKGIVRQSGDGVVNRHLLRR